jgi:hypothetical protein
VILNVEIENQTPIRRPDSMGQLPANLKMRNREDCTGKYANIVEPILHFDLLVSRGYIIPIQLPIR